jgi:hypothetical protein
VALVAQLAGRLRVVPWELQSRHGRSPVVDGTLPDEFLRLRFVFSDGTSLDELHPRLP